MVRGPNKTTVVGAYTKALFILEFLCVRLRYLNINIAVPTTVLLDVEYCEIGERSAA